MDAEISDDDALAIAIAGELIAAGVPVFVAKPARAEDGSWNPRGGSGGCGYWLPTGWQHCTPNPAVLDAWEPGDGLAATGNGSVTFVDVDTYNGGDASLFGLQSAGAWPQTFGEAETTSGGKHFVAGNLGLRTSAGHPEGIDIRGGIDGSGVGFVWLAPTRRLNKHGEIRSYRWTSEPDLDALAEYDVDEDDGGIAFVAAVTDLAAGVEPLDDLSGGREYDALTSAQRKRVDGYVENTIAGLESELREAKSWPEGQRDSRGRGWEKLTADAFWKGAKVAAAQWNPISLAEVERRLVAAAPELPDLGRKFRVQSRRATPAPLPFDVTVDREKTDGTTFVVDTVAGAELDTQDISPQDRLMEAYHGWRDTTDSDVRRILGLRLPPSSQPADVANLLRQKVFVDDEGNRTLLSWNYDWYLREGERWRVINDEDLKRIVTRILHCSHTVTADKTKPWNPTGNKVRSVLDSLAMELHLNAIYSPPCYLPGPSFPSGTPDANRLIAFRNGTVDSETGAFTPGINSRLFNMTSVGHNYRENMPEPEHWITFLHSIFGDDPESIELLRQWGYYLLSGDRKQQKAMLLLGPPRSGKGTILHILFDVLGLPPGDRATPTLSSLAGQFSAQVFIGKPFVAFADARIERGGNREVVERLVSITGNDPQTIKRKYKEDWVGELPSRIMLISNEVPRFSDASGALASRFIALETKTSFLDREDTGLLDRLKSELPQILWWFLQAREQFVKTGRFIDNAATRELRSEMKTSGSVVRAFIEEGCILDPELFTPKKEFKLALDNYCRENGHHVLSPRSIISELRAMSADVPGIGNPAEEFKPRVTVNGASRRVPCYRGFRLRTLSDDLGDAAADAVAEDAATLDDSLPAPY